MAKKLTDYLNEMENAYIEARSAFDTAENELSTLKKVNDSNMSNNHYTAQAKLELLSNYKEAQREIISNLQKARKEFLETCDQIKEHVNSDFKSKYAPTADCMDLKAAEMLKSGMLTEKEVKEIVMNYKKSGNNTMYRYSATFLDDKSSDGEVQSLALDAKRPYTRPDLEIVDHFIEICSKGLRDDLVLSNGIHRVHDKFKESIYNSAQDLEGDAE